MSEKRFSVRLRSECDGVVYSFFDGDKPLDVEMIVDVLNTQQTTINKQLDQIIELQDKYRILEFNHSRLEKRNKAQYEKIGEQQATNDYLEEANSRLQIQLGETLRLVDEQQSTINKLQKELVSVCEQKSLLCDELEILKKVVKDE